MVTPQGAPFFCKYTKTVLVFILSISFLFAYWQHSQVKVPLRFLDRDGRPHTLFLSLKDRKRLLSFTRLLFAEDNFAYTLLGTKPVSWACYQKPLPLTDLSTFCSAWGKYHRTLHVGWKTWLKYRDSFLSVAFWEESGHSDRTWISIVIVNEEEFNHVVNSNKKDFEQVLRRNVVDGFQLLKEAKNSSLMSGVLGGHQALLGIVLGYGRENSWAFLESSQKREPLGCVWSHPEEQISGAIQTRVGATDLESCLALESCPTFAGYPDSEESLELKKNYLLIRERVIEYYKNKDFLEATLSLLAGFRPPTEKRESLENL